MIDTCSGSLSQSMKKGELRLAVDWRRSGMRAPDATFMCSAVDRRGGGVSATLAGTVAEVRGLPHGGELDSRGFEGGRYPPKSSSSWYCGGRVPRVPGSVGGGGRSVGGGGRRRDWPMALLDGWISIAVSLRDFRVGGGSKLDVDGFSVVIGRSPGM